MANPNIFQQYLQAPRSMADYEAEYDQSDARRTTNALAALTLQQQNESMATARGDRNALEQIAARYAGDPDAYTQALLASGRAGLMAQGDARQKAAVDRRNIESQISERGAKTADDKFKTQQAQQNAAIARIANFSDAGNAAQELRAAVQRGEIPEHVGAAIERTIPQNPAAFGEWKLRAIVGMTDPAKMAELLQPKLDTQNLGGTTQYTSRDPMTGAVTVNRVDKNTQSPDNAATVGAAYAGASATREVAKATRDAAHIQTEAKNEGDLRQEFAGLPEVKKYKNAVPAYQAVVQASKTNNPQADINLIYGLAKLYDPDSVVREGEYGTIANSQSIPEWLKGQAQRLMGGGRLTEATKKQILEQAKVRIDTFENEYNGARRGYEGIAGRRGMNPANVFTPVGEQTRPAAPSPGGGLTIDPAAISAELARRGGR